MQPAARCAANQAAPRQGPGRQSLRRHVEQRSRGRRARRRAPGRAARSRAGAPRPRPPRRPASGSERPAERPERHADRAAQDQVRHTAATSTARPEPPAASVRQAPPRAKGTPRCPRGPLGVASEADVRRPGARSSMGAPRGCPRARARPVVARFRGRAIAAVAVFCAMLWLVPVVDHAFGPLAGYGFLLAAITFGGLALRPLARPPVLARPEGLPSLILDLLERDGERAVLAAAIEESRESGRVALVVGEAGIGKTALVADACRETRRRAVGRVRPADHAAADGAAARRRAARLGGELQSRARRPASRERRPDRDADRSWPTAPCS